MKVEENSATLAWGIQRFVNLCDGVTKQAVVSSTEQNAILAQPSAVEECYAFNVHYTLYKIKLDFVDLLRPSNNYEEKQRGYFI